jgi:hypothetical protein
LVFERASQTVEGNLWLLRFEQPYYSLKQRYAWAARYERDDRVARAVRDGVVLVFPEEPGYPGPYTEWKYRRALDRGSLSAGLRVGERVKHALSGGWDYRNQVASSIAVPAELEEAFALHVLPKERRESGPSLAYEFFTPTWVTFVNLSTYGKSENVQVGPRAFVSTRLPLRALGSSTDSWVIAGEAGWSSSTSARSCSCAAHRPHFQCCAWWGASPSTCATTIPRTRSSRSAATQACAAMRARSSGASARTGWWPTSSCAPCRCSGAPCSSAA